MTLDGLSFGVLKEQEFHFKSQLNHHQYQHTSTGTGMGHHQYPVQVGMPIGHQPSSTTAPPNTTATSVGRTSVPGSTVTLGGIPYAGHRSRALSLPSQPQPTFGGIYPYSTGSQLPHPFPNVFKTPTTTSTTSSSSMGHTLQSVSSSGTLSASTLSCSSFGLAPIREEGGLHAPQPSATSSLSSTPGTYRTRRVGVSSGMQGITTYTHTDPQQSVSATTVLVSNKRHVTTTAPTHQPSYKLSNSVDTQQDDQHRKLKQQSQSQTQQQQAPRAPSYKKPRDYFQWGDPNSDRLAEFVSRMVFVIFWHGTETYAQAIQTHLFQHHHPTSMPLTPDGGSKSSHHSTMLSHVRFSSSHAPATICSMFQPTSEFIQYTKWLLETMQISCSTGLLALFYLHRLRPRVKHLFVPGTFEGGSSDGCSDVFQQQQHPLTPPRYQYRRDPKLEYRLFTISLVLANKYLDDHSYSNRAWADVTGLDLRKINIMELEFMKYIDYQLLAKEREYVLWIRWLETFIGPATALSASSQPPHSQQPTSSSSTHQNQPPHFQHRSSSSTSPTSPSARFGTSGGYVRGRRATVSQCTTDARPHLARRWSCK